MARVLIDDMTEELIRGESEGGTHTLALDDEAVELDLTTVSKDKLRELLAPYFAAGREVATRGRPRGSKPTTSTASAGPAAEPASSQGAHAVLAAAALPPDRYRPSHVELLLDGLAGWLGQAGEP